MSVSLGKLNKAGLGNGSFGVNKKTTGVSTQAAKNLASSSAATKSSVFSFGQSRGTNWVGGQHINRDTSKYNYQGIRNQANARGVYTPQRGNNISHAQTTVKYTGDDGTNFMKGQLIGQTIMGGINLLNQLGAFKSLSQPVSSSHSNLYQETGNDSIPLGNVSNGNVAASITSMSSCNDSASLRSAIASADGQLTSLNAQTGTYESAATSAKDQIGTLESGVSTASTAEEKAKQGLSTAQSTVQGYERARDSQMIAMEQADSNYAQASKNYTQAHDACQEAQVQYGAAQRATTSAKTSLDNAQATLDSLEQTIPDGKGGTMTNPAWTKAKEARDAAKQKYDQAVADESNKKTAYDSAKTAEAEAQKAKDAAYEQLGDKKAAVDKVEKDLKDAQTKLDSAKEKEQVAKENLEQSSEALEEAKENLSNAQGAVEQFKAHTQDVKTLQNAIAKQKQRLAKLENEEIKVFQTSNKKLSNGIAKNNNRTSGIVGDVDTKKERKLSNQIGKQNVKNEGYLSNLNSVRGNVNQTYISNTLINQPPVATIENQRYHSGVNPVTNETVYSRDGQMISKEEFEQALKGVNVNL